VIERRSDQVVHLTGSATVRVTLAAAIASAAAVSGRNADPGAGFLLPWHGPTDDRAGCMQVPVHGRSVTVDWAHALIDRHPGGGERLIVEVPGREAGLAAVGDADQWQVENGFARRAMRIDRQPAAGETSRSQDDGLRRIGNRAGCVGDPDCFDVAVTSGGAGGGGAEHQTHACGAERCGHGIEESHPGYGWGERGHFEHPSPEPALEFLPRLLRPAQAEDRRARRRVHPCRACHPTIRRASRCSGCCRIAPQACGR